MSEQASQIPPKGLWTVKASDFIKGLWLSIASGVLALSYFIVDNHFKLPTMEQADPYLRTIGAGFLAYIAKNLGTNNVGEFLKKDKSVVVVSQKKVDDLQQKSDENDESK